VQYKGAKNSYEDWSTFMAQNGFREVGDACKEMPYGESDGIWVYP
jgi:hypothetical protein